MIDATLTTETTEEEEDTFRQEDEDWRIW